ncbi:hypothetical protein AB6E22_09475, partial [Vibrio cyclitrophicus]
SKFQSFKVSKFQSFKVSKFQSYERRSQERLFCACYLVWLLCAQALILLGLMYLWSGFLSIMIIVLQS